jgi:hypothetical protein
MRPRSPRLAAQAKQAAQAKPASDRELPEDRHTAVKLDPHRADRVREEETECIRRRAGIS